MCEENLPTLSSSTPQDREPAAVLLLMAKLYAVEKEAREAAATHEQRLALRQQRSVALFEQLQAKITQIAVHALPSSKLAAACQYALNQGERLKAYLQNGRIEIDQNLCENAMRALAVGRKNWLHIGSQEAGPKIAAILSVMETCKCLQINLRKYLNDVLPKLPSWPINDVAALSPLNWKPSRLVFQNLSDLTILRPGTSLEYLALPMRILRNRVGGRSALVASGIILSGSDPSNPRPCLLGTREANVR
jgi:hypothetical protein